MNFFNRGKADRTPAQAAENRMEQKAVKKLLLDHIRTTESYVVHLQNVAEMFAQSTTEDPEVQATPAVIDTAILANRAVAEHCRRLLSRLTV